MTDSFPFPDITFYDTSMKNKNVEYRNWEIYITHLVVDMDTEPKRIEEHQGVYYLCEGWSKSQRFSGILPLPVITGWVRLGSSCHIEVTEINLNGDIGANGFGHIWHEHGSNFKAVREAMKYVDDHANDLANYFETSCDLLSTTDWLSPEGTVFCTS